jgi:FkbM family methyltransferase
MKTLHKIALARTLYWALRTVRRTDHVVAKRGGIWYSLDLSQGIDLSIYLFSEFERPTAAALRKYVQPGSTVLDIGANIGAHTLPLAKLVGPSGRVIAFEPTEFAFLKLQTNLALNPQIASRVEALECFLGAGNSAPLPPSIPASWPLRSGRNLHPKHGGEASSTGSAVSRSLDSILADRGNPPISLVKMDVDGFECDVLSGMKRTIAECRPLFIMELAPYCLRENGTSLDQMLSFFAPYGYVLRDLVTERSLPTDASELERSVGDGASINVIAEAPTRGHAAFKTPA